MFYFETNLFNCSEMDVRLFIFSRGIALPKLTQNSKIIHPPILLIIRDNADNGAASFCDSNSHISLEF